MKLNIANPWTRFYLSCGAVVLVFCIFVFFYKIYKHPYYGERLFSISFFKDADKSATPLYEISADDSCIKAIQAGASEDKKAGEKKSAISLAHSPHCKSAISVPEEAKQLGKEGFVELALFIQRDGTVKRADISQSSGVETLDQAAINQIKSSWQFEPCLKAGAAIECRQLVRVRWK